jgi:hypothetical protein
MSSATSKNGSPTRRIKGLAWGRCLLLCLASLCCCAVGRAQTPAPPPPAPTPAPAPGSPGANPCQKPQGEKKGLNDWFKCLKHYYDKATSKDGPRVVFGGVAPGGGLGGGIGYGYRGRSTNWQRKLDASARATIKKYWEVDANLRLTKSSSTFGKCDEWGPQGALKIDLYGQVKDMQRLDYFGLGPASREQDRAVFHYREGVVGADISKPSSHLCWLDVGGAAEVIFPDIVRIANPTVRSVERVYTEGSAPGLVTQPNYLHFAAYARVHSRKQPEARRIDYLFIYHAYQDVQEHRYSFRRFDADLRNKFPIGEKSEIRVRGRLSLSETREGQSVPFYLMETLGGSNIRGDDTLRGFRDYRFRDRDYALLQTEFLQRIYGPLDFIAFYDTGKVASSVSHFGDGRLRHTYGLGVVVVPRQLDNVLFRFYVSFGSGEGSRTYLGGGGSGRGSRLVR